MQPLAKFKQILYLGFRATLNFLLFGESYIISIPCLESVLKYLQCVVSGHFVL